MLCEIGCGDVADNGHRFCISCNKWICEQKVKNRWKFNYQVCIEMMQKHYKQCPKKLRVTGITGNKVKDFAQFLIYYGFMSTPTEPEPA